LQGLEKGKEIGKEEGKLEEKKAIARALLAILDIETLAQKTGLPIEDMQTLI
jgi:predicted transposase YdaD